MEIPLQTKMIDDLGRVQIPKEIRREFNIEPGDKIEISADLEMKTITLKKVNE